VERVTRAEVLGTTTTPATVADELLTGGAAAGGVAAGGDTLTVAVVRTPLTTVVTVDEADADGREPGEGGFATSTMRRTVTATSTGRAYARQP